MELNRTEPDRLLRRSDVERRTGLGRSAFYAHMAAGTFPRPYSLGGQAVRWSAAEIEEWCRTLPRSHGGRQPERVARVSVKRA